MAIDMAIPELPRDCGKRLIAHYIHQTAIDEPHRVCISRPLTSEPHDGFEDITFSQLDKAIDVASNWVEKHAGIGEDFDCIAYIGPHDLRYILLMIAAIKTGHKLFVPSPRNSLEAHTKLLQDYRCKNFLFAKDSSISQKIVNDIQTKVDLQTIAVPTLNYFFHPGFDVPHYKYTATYEEARFQPLVAMHTSGTTGTPKTIVMPQGVITGLDASQKATLLYGTATTSDYFRGLRCFFAFPLFHAAGVCRIMTALYFKQIAVLPPPIPLTAEIANEVHIHGKVQVSDLPPAVLVEISKTPEYLKNLRPVKYIMTGGGPLPNGPGDIINSHTRLFAGFGSTETGHIQAALPPKENWDYFDFSTSFGAVMKHHSGELYELVVVRDPSIEAYQGIFYTFPDLSEYKSRDLFSRHPSKNNLWRHEGRSDDIIVYSTGEKFNPTSMENVLNSHPGVKSAIVHGTKKFQSSLLIEPTNPESSKDDLLDELWPAIKAANISCPAHARIMSKDFVAFTRPDKPFPRAGKGTIQRKQAEKLYETELNSLYDTKTDGHGTKNENANGNNSANEGASSAEQDIIIQAISGIQGLENLSPSDNFFEQGLDSLGVISIARAVNLAFQLQNPPRNSMPTSMIYAYPSLEKLSYALSSTVKDENDFDEMQAEYDRFTFDLPIIARPSTPVTGPKVFLLTGSTGSLGSYILSNILQQDKSCKVYCLNRGEGSEKRQLNSNSSKGLPINFSRVRFLGMAADTTEPWLGIELVQYKELLNKVTHIIHNAWHVDFNMSLSQMGATHLHRVRQLIDFSAHSRFGASIHFISSISTVGNWDVIGSNTPSSSGSSTPSQLEAELIMTKLRVPEIPYENWSLPQGLGYGQSKFIAERLFTTACKVANIPASIYRVGQIAGPKSSKGKWNEQEWFPLILKSSTYLKVLPSSLGPLEAVDWIPVDILGKVVYELATSSNNDTLNLGSAINSSSVSPRFYHLVNPKRTTYSDAILPRLQSILDLPTIPFEEWVQRLCDSAASTQDMSINDNPAVKILGFYKDLVEKEKKGRTQVWLDTEKAVEGSPTLKGMDMIDEDCVNNWMRQWGYIRNEHGE
ncbi:similar to NRPS-like enzyme [Botrytis cinerea T4]|uniref:Similar to NRPS-like enzyme n=1 Tax=Botryotinia fuckeliana (strain T4) TaxID=999810 RepID=G2YU94_BOTF4|nr:similar to NRPS-like enzyme [Botrytis cinerea T4]